MKEMEINKKIKCFVSLKIYLLFLFFYLLFYLNSKNFTIIKTDNQFNQSKYFKIKSSLDFYKLFDIKYTYSFKYKIVKFEYNFEFYENNSSLVVPSDITLYKNLHIFCHYESNNSNIIINSFPDIVENKNFKCIEYFNINENIKIGIKIYEINGNGKELKNNIIYFYNGEILNFWQLFNNNDKLFDPLIINEKYMESLYKYINDTKLKKSFTKMPKCILKNNLIINENQCSFGNIFNEYFCFCKDLNSLKLKNIKKCKYFFYLNLIDKNRKVYPKTDFLFIDFIFNELTSDDAFPIFKEMLKENLPVHYLTEWSEIYNEYCSKINKCQIIIPVNRLNFTINGDFLEKYLTLFLKLKQVVDCSGVFFNYFNNLFYNIEYITYISITHGVCYFKYFLYKENECYGIKRIDKILVPPSEKIIYFAIKFGWKKDNIIKLNLPKWDNYNERNNSSTDFSKNIINYNNSILIMFTWRDIIKNRKISPDYFKNIINLIQHQKLKEELKNNNITLYFTLHHKIYENNKHIFMNIKYIKFIDQKSISDYIKKSNLLITDFSSIIFDFVYRRKPFIIYIPDHNDTLINLFYKRNYYELIRSMKNGTIEFENTFYNIDLVVNKIIFYIKNNFQLDERLKIFYDNLNIIHKDNIYEFIKYIKNIN